MQSSPEQFLPIGDYGLLSDCHSTALVSSAGSIDWACLRRFDSGSSFARILDHVRGGHFAITPVATIVERSRRYLPGTMVLETTLGTGSGTIRITDAFSMRVGGASDPQTHVLRRVECIDGSVEVEVDITPRFDYGSLHPWVRSHGERRYSAVGGDDAIALSATVELEIHADESGIGGRFELDEGDGFAIEMVAQPAHRLDVSAADAGTVDQQLDTTVDWWTDWTTATFAQGPYAELIERSALVLKSLCCAPTGAIIAAPTTSLPEVPGGDANWDYRYCWVRDSTLALAALDEVGHPEVAEGFRNFVMRSAAGRGDELQIMYGAYGERRLPELEVELDGWRDSKPVRVGNGAASQIQLDVYGHLLDAAHQWHSRSESIDADEWAFLRSVVDQAEASTDERDAGIWELRGEPQHYVHSKVMVWVALDRGVRLATGMGLDCDGETVARWTESRDRLRSEIEERGVDERTGGFVQYYGADDVDASLLKLALVGFVDACDERMIATVDAIQQQLASSPDGFLRRFDQENQDGADDDSEDDDESAGQAGDGSDGDTEGVFLLCSFWLVEVLAMQHRIDEAVELFERLIALGNDLGLFAEEYDVTNRELLGNFPQAFTHLGLICAAGRLRDTVARDAGASAVARDAGESDRC